ncbi:MAG: methionine ABC transporter substrate-binding protein [Treponema sp.]|nr:methionine ABC transporter substrate-binding protein [Treponema sp.]MCH5293834.1 methionine ABC transporter substrate-binding protein [Treponema sp.]
MKKSIAAFLVGAVALAGVFAAKPKNTVVRLGVVGSIYEDLWAPAQKALKKQGIDLKFVQFSDYVTPNNALSNGEIDLNAFQHRIFLENEIATHKYDVKLIGNTFIIPLNLYSVKVKSVSELKEGAVIAIPNDVTNGGRAIKVLASAGLITLKSGAGFNPTVDDIADNKGIVIRELSANTIPSALADVDAAIVNGNYALDFGIKPENAIFKDTSVDEKEYWNLVAARGKDLNDPAKLEVFKKVVKAFQTKETEDIFNKKFGGYFIKEGWDIDEFAK